MIQSFTHVEGQDRTKRSSAFLLYGTYYIGERHIADMADIHGTVTDRHADRQHTNHNNCIIVAFHFFNLDCSSVIHTYTSRTFRDLSPLQLKFHLGCSVMK